MVDFQSRNSRRTGTGSDDDDELAQADSADDVADPADDVADSTAPSEAAAVENGDAASERNAVAAAIVTVSDERTTEADPGTDAVAEAFESADHEVRTRESLHPSHDSVQETVDRLVSRDDVTVVVTTGGTGVTSDDVTVEAVHPLIDKGLPGFGEAFRRRYADAVGTDAIGTRATAGIAGTTPVFCLPGDPEAAHVGTSELVVEQAARLARLASDDA